MTERTHHLLVVDDDVRLRDLLTRYLGDNGFEVKAVADGAQMDRLRTREHFDLLVLDLMMPGEDGLTICRRLRGTGDKTPIIMLTAKGDEVDRIVGLEMGADDYLPKPFNPRELLARIHAVLRRQGTQPPGAPEGDSELVHFDPQTNVIDVHISRLRSKIDKGFKQSLLHTIRGAGYMIRDSVR